jgi:hypothetical protein
VVVVPILPWGDGGKGRMRVEFNTSDESGPERLMVDEFPDSYRVPLIGEHVNFEYTRWEVTDVVWQMDPVRSSDDVDVSVWMRKDNA